MYNLEVEKEGDKSDCVCNASAKLESSDIDRSTIHSSTIFGLHGRATNIFITQPRNQNFLDLLDASVSNFGRIYLGHCDFNSSPITLLTFCYFISIEFSVPKLYPFFQLWVVVSCPSDAPPPQGYQPSNKCGRKVAW